MFIRQGKTNIKYLLIVAILTAIVGVGVLWYMTKKESPSVQLPVIQKSQDETADWETYRNEKYGYEVKYPKEANLQMTENQSFVYFEYLNIKPGFHKFFEIYNLESCKETIAKLVVNGIEFGVASGTRQASEMPETKGYIRSHYTKINNGSCLTILFNVWGSADKEPTFDELFEPEEDLKVFSQMLSTFRFLE